LPLLALLFVIRSEAQRPVIARSTAIFATVVFAVILSKAKDPETLHEATPSNLFTGQLKLFVLQLCPL
jgi:hypothetical protein